MLDIAAGMISATAGCSLPLVHPLFQLGFPRFFFNGFVDDSGDGVMWRIDKIIKVFDMWVFPKIGVPQHAWFIMENPIKMGDVLGVPLFLETPMCIIRFLIPWYLLDDFVGWQYELQVLHCGQC